MATHHGFLTASGLLVKRNGQVYDDRSVDHVFLGIVQKAGNQWSATSSITHTEQEGFRIRHDAVWWLLEQYKGDN